MPGTRTEIAEFPSWSWCGWSTAVEWRLSTTANILNNMHEWLSEHTWVVWFIGTSDSSCELIWDVAPGKEKSTRWDGYTAGNDQTPYGRSSLSEMALEVSAFETVPTCPPIQGCLHFWTYSAIFSLIRTSMSNATFKSTLSPGLHRFGIQDAKGDWCGTIILDETFFNQVDGQFEFIATSEAKDFELEEFDSWTYYVLQEREQAEWYLYYALMIRWNEKDIAERLGLAKIYKMAFHSASFEPGLRWKEIALR